MKDLISPANVLAFAPIIELVVGLIVVKVLAGQVDALLAKELGSDNVPNIKVRAVGKDQNALRDLKRYLGYGARLGKTLEASIIAMIAVILSGYERTGSFSVSGLYLIVFLVLLLNLGTLLLRLATDRIDALRDKAAVHHYCVALLLSASVIVLNIVKRNHAGLE